MFARIAGKRRVEHMLRQRGATVPDGWDPKKRWEREEPHKYHPWNDMHVWDLDKRHSGRGGSAAGGRRGAKPVGGRSKPRPAARERPVYNRPPP